MTINVQTVSCWRIRWLIVPCAMSGEKGTKNLIGIQFFVSELVRSPSWVWQALGPLAFKTINIRFSHLYCGECHQKSTVIWWELHCIWPNVVTKTINFRYVADYRNKQQLVTVLSLQFFVLYKIVAPALLYQTVTEASIYEENFVLTETSKLQIQLWPTQLPTDEYL